jgi:topoisomerase IA-like protein
MATFTEAQVTDIATVMEASSEYISGHLGVYGGFITESDKTAILADAAAYLLIQDDNVNIYAKESNRGAQINASAARRLIRDRVGKKMLLLPTSMQSTPFEAELIRG